MCEEQHPETSGETKRLDIDYEELALLESFPRR
jgi:hypothetical protein